MDTNLTYIIILLILAVIAIVAFFPFRQRTRIDVQGPFGTGVKVDAFISYQVKKVKAITQVIVIAPERATQKRTPTL